MIVWFVAMQHLGCEASSLFVSKLPQHDTPQPTHSSSPNHHTSSCSAQTLRRVSSLKEVLRNCSIWNLFLERRMPLGDALGLHKNSASTFVIPALNFLGNYAPRLLIFKDVTLVATPTFSCLIRIYNTIIIRCRNIYITANERICSFSSIRIIFAIIEYIFT